MRHYYRVTKNSDMGKDIFRLLHECHKAEVAADNYAKSAGAVSYLEETNVFEGGVSFLIFDKDRKVDSGVWRSVGTVSGEECYEPNCHTQMSAAVLMDRNFWPSDTSTEIFEKHERTFSEVFGLCPLAHWAKVAHYELRGTEHLREDIQYLQKYFENTSFVKYMQFSSEDGADTKSPIGKKLKVKDKKAAARRNAELRKAIRMERMRFNLPVITMGRVLNTLQAETSEIKKQQMEFTPMFFPEGDSYWVSMQFTCTNKLAERINAETFNYHVNLYNNAIERERQQEQQEKELLEQMRH